MTDTWEPTPPAPPSLRRARQAVLASYFGLLGLFIADSLLLIVIKGAPFTVALVFWLVKSLPLMLFWPALRVDNLRGHAWLSFVILLYFAHAVITAFVPGELLYGLVYSGLCTALFIALLMYIRLARHYLGLSLFR